MAHNNGMIRYIMIYITLIQYESRNHMHILEDPFYNINDNLAKLKTIKELSAGHFVTFSVVE